MLTIVLAALFTLVSLAAHAAEPAGVFALWRTGVPIAATAAGVTCNVTWSQVEPAPGSYVWTDPDACIAAAGARPVKLGIEGGVYSPAWLYNAGAKRIDMTWAWNFGFPMCSVQWLPLPWDPIFISAWNRLTSALGARYAGNKQVVAVTDSALMGKDEEDVLETTAPTVCPNALDPQALWLAAGYRPDLISGAFATTLAAYAAAFPQTALVLETGSWPFPGIDNSGQATKPDYALTAALTEQFAGAPHAIIMNDGLEAGAWSYKLPAPVADAPFALQEGAPLTGNSACTDNGGVTPCVALTVLQAMLAKAMAEHALFVEFYPPDINNPDPAFAAALAGFNPKGGS